LSEHNLIQAIVFHAAVDSFEFGGGTRWAGLAY
jgi:hypothetical protein